MAISLEQGTAENNALYDQTNHLTNENAITVCCWFKLNSVTTDDTWNIFKRSGATTHEGMDVKLDGGTRKFRVTSFNASAFGSACTLNTWYFVAFARNGDVRDLYVGTEAAAIGASPDASVNNNTQIDTINETVISFGYQSIASVAYYRQWAATLTRNEIEAERLKTTPQKTGCYRHCVFNVYNNLADSSGNGRDYTGNGTLSTVTGPNLGAVRGGMVNRPPLNGLVGGGLAR